MLRTFLFRSSVRQPSRPPASIAVVAATRLMSNGRTEGAIRDAGTGFSKKEKAVEDQWIRTQDSDKLKHLHDELAKQKQKLKELEDNIEELGNEIDQKKQN